MRLKFTAEGFITAWLLSAALALRVSAVAAVPALELKVGDQAPLPNPMEWTRGKAISQYEPGRVYVVEFWATWCPPCIKAIPHLSRLHAKYSNRLTIIGVNAESLLGNDADLENVHRFVERHKGDMTYTIAIDDPVKTSEKWVTGTGSLGVPTAGIVDRRGKLVWIGYPDVQKDYTFDEALTDALADKADLSKSRALQFRTSAETAQYWASHK